MPKGARHSEEMTELGDQEPGDGPRTVTPSEGHGETRPKTVAAETDPAGRTNVPCGQREGDRHPREQARARTPQTGIADDAPPLTQRAGGRVGCGEGRWEGAWIPWGGRVYGRDRGRIESHPVQVLAV